jgi:hypothetical protein
MMLTRQGAAHRGQHRKAPELMRKPRSGTGTPWGSQGKHGARPQVQHWPGTACRCWVLQTRPGAPAAHSLSLPPCRHSPAPGKIAERFEQKRPTRRPMRRLRRRQLGSAWYGSSLCPIIARMLGRHQAHGQLRRLYVLRAVGRCGASVTPRRRTSSCCRNLSSISV